jgi:hypothetical protein
VPTELLVDPRVSKRKFDRELAQFRMLQRDYHRRGWWLIEAEFPNIFIVFASSKLKPPAAAFGAILNFENYDLWSPSLQLVDPFTRVPYKFSELPSPLLRRVDRVAVVTDQSPSTHNQRGEQISLVPIMQSHDNETCFACLPGVREYHNHPAHTGDSWLLRRGSGEGTLHFIIENLSRYGLEAISEYSVSFQITQIKIGLAINQTAISR